MYIYIHKTHTNVTTVDIGPRTAYSILVLSSTYTFMYIQ